MTAALDRAKLSRVLGMLNSRHDGEVLAAARQAERLRREAGATWFDILMPPPAIVRPVSIADEIGLCLARRDDLTTWEQIFVNSIAQQHYPLTVRQQEVLERITRKILAREMAA